MNVDGLLKLSTMHRRSVIAVMFLSLAATLVLLWAVSGKLGSVVEALVTSLLGAILSILVAYFLFVLLVSKGKVELYELQPREITKEFDIILAEATSWHYKGNFGRYLRGKVLPTLNRGASVVVCIIDPSDRSLCEKHAGYRSRINSIDKGVRYTADSVALQVLVTIIICGWYKSNKGVDIRVYLTRTYDPVRIDANQSTMIVTVEDRRSPALKLIKGHFMFEHFSLQMHTARDQGRALSLPEMRVCGITDISARDVELALKGTGLDGLVGFSYEEVAASCRQIENPYEN